MLHLLLFLVRLWGFKFCNLVQNSPKQKIPIQNSPENYENEQKTVLYKTAQKTDLSNNFYNKPVGRELSFALQTK